MPRKSRQLDQRLLNAGARLLAERGWSGFSVREVAEEAGVNLGMFHYHFGSREQFLRAILNERYLPFLRDLEQLQDQSLEAVLLRMARFSRDQESVLLALLGDLVCGDKTILRFLRKHFLAHFKVLRGALESHFRRQRLPPSELPHAFRFLVGSVGLPNLLLGLERKLHPSAKTSPDPDQRLLRRVRATVAALPSLCGGGKECL